MPFHPRYSRPSWCFCCSLVLSATLVARSEEPAAAPSPKSLLIELKAIEVNTGKMKKRGFEWTQLDGQGTRRFTVEEFAPFFKDRAIPAGHFDGFLRALHQNGLARVIVEPTLVTLDGRPASFTVGPTQLDMVPIVLASGRVKLECRLKTSETSVITADGETDLGATFILRNTAMRDPRLSSPPESEMLVLAKVDLLKSGRISKVIAQPTDVEVKGSVIEVRQLQR